MSVGMSWYDTDGTDLGFRHSDGRPRTEVLIDAVGDFVVLLAVLFALPFC